MEQKKFRLRLNLFDGIVLVLALAAGAFLLWNALRPQTPAQTAAPQATSAVRYTLRLLSWPEGNSALVQTGDLFIDNIRNFELGHVVSCQAVPAETTALDQEHRVYRQAVLEGCEDVLVTLEADCTADSESIQVGGGYTLRVGATAYIKGPGYVGSGPITAIELEGAK